MTQTCATCHFHIGEDCRLAPPVIVVKRGEIVACWPAVEADDWCGQWSPAARASEGESDER